MHDAPHVDLIPIEGEKHDAPPCRNVNDVVCANRWYLKLCNVQFEVQCTAVLCLKLLLTSTCRN